MGDAPSPALRPLRRSASTRIYFATVDGLCALLHERPLTDKTSIRLTEDTLGAPALRLSPAVPTCLRASLSWRNLVRGVFFRVAAEAWVETGSVGRHQWGWRLRNREGLVIKSLNGRHGAIGGAAFDAGVRFFRRRSGAAGDIGRFVGRRSGHPPGQLPGARPETGARAARLRLTERPIISVDAGSVKENRRVSRRKGVLR